MKKILIIIILLCISTPVKASCTLVMDASSGRVLFGENEHTKHLIASTTKIMTAFVTLNNSDINKKTKVGDEVIDAYGSAIYIKPGEVLTIKDLLYGLLLRSGNDAALTLSKEIGGSSLGMAKLMNETALAIGMKDTKFYNPHGLDEETQNLSTCYDMALLLKEAIKNKEFRKISKTKKYDLKTNFNTYSWYNKNKLLSIYKYAQGGKIGYTKRAGHAFVSYAKKGDKTLIISSLKDSDIFNHHKRLYEKYFSQYKNYKLIDKNNLHINFDNNYNVYTLSSYNILLKKDELNQVKREVKLYNSINYKEKNTVVGKITIKLNNQSLTEKNIYAVKKKKVFKKLLK